VHRAEAPRRKLRGSGTGDTFSALFTGHYVRDRDAGGALDFAMHAMDVICTATEKADADELRADPERLSEVDPSLRDFCTRAM
jgi:pyridoxine kinase